MSKIANRSIVQSFNHPIIQTNNKLTNKLTNNSVRFVTKLTLKLTLANATTRTSGKPGIGWPGRLLAGDQAEASASIAGDQAEAGDQAGDQVAEVLAGDQVAEASAGDQAEASARFFPKGQEDGFPNM